jgi:hypothetical protein
VTFLPIPLEACMLPSWGSSPCARGQPAGGQERKTKPRRRRARVHGQAMAPPFIVQEQRIKMKPSCLSLLALGRTQRGVGARRLRGSATLSAAVGGVRAAWRRQPCRIHREERSPHFLVLSAERTGNPC